ncbi:MAG: efflux RND transporter periplasmic adaptor subunit [Planctomycetales bacterium]|nr:efflux RND transporter periplasmic adaptor subunit [Planctomycetales bacterium]
MPAIIAEHDPTTAAYMSHEDRLRAKLLRLAVIADLVARMESAPNAKATCQVLANELKRFLEVDQVLVGLCANSADCRLTAISDCPTFNPGDPRSAAAQSVLQEAIASGHVTHWPADKQHRGGLLAHRQYAASHRVKSIVSSPLRDAEGRLRGAWMVVGGQPQQVALANELMRAAESPVASALYLSMRADGGSLRQSFVAARNAIRSRPGKLGLAATALLLAALLTPFTYHPRCECTVEPVLRRFVAVPFDGPLEETMVAPGEEVKAGQLLARMDGREVRWELAGIRAELHRATKEHAGHLAAHESGNAEVARHEVDRLQVRTELLEQRQRNLEIRSPFHGLIVSGDLEDTEGIPLKTGDTLFEVAPLDRMVVELAVREDDYALVRPGMPVTIRLAAFPLRKLQATIDRIHPRSELREDENVFVAEVHIENANGALRPGMRGKAKIRGDRRTLGWILLRRPLAACLSWLGW